jgi:hypothetical protein
MLRGTNCQCGAPGTRPSAVLSAWRQVLHLSVGVPRSSGLRAIVGMAAAIANAVYHATGARVRSLPISIEKVLGYESSSPHVSSPLAVIAEKAQNASHEAVQAASRLQPTRSVVNARTNPAQSRRSVGTPSWK